MTQKHKIERSQFAPQVEFYCDVYCFKMITLNEKRFAYGFPKIQFVTDTI